MARSDYSAAITRFRKRQSRSSVVESAHEPWNSSYTRSHLHPTSLAALDEKKRQMMGGESPLRSVTSAVYGEFASPMSSQASLDMGVMGNTAAAEGLGMPRTGSHPRTRVRPRTGELPRIEAASPVPAESRFSETLPALPNLPSAKVRAIKSRGYQDPRGGRKPLDLPSQVGYRNPITAEWVIHENDLGVQKEAKLPVSLGNGKLPVPVPKVLGTKEGGSWKVKPDLDKVGPGVVADIDGGAGILGASTQWEEVPHEVQAMYKADYGEFKPITKRVDEGSFGRHKQHPLTGEFRPGVQPPQAVGTFRTQKVNEGHFEGMSANKYNSEEESRYQRPMFGLRKYHTNKNEGHFTTGWTPSRGAPPIPAVWGITGNGVWS